MTNTANHIKNFCLAFSLLLIVGIGNNLSSQSFDKEDLGVQTTVKSLEVIVKVYPNPTTDYVTITTEDKFEGRYKLNNIFGKNLIEGEVKDQSETIDLLEYRTGIYIISLYDDQGQKVATRKIIKN